MNIPKLLEEYGRLNRMIGDYRTERSVVLTDEARSESRQSMGYTMQKLAGVENLLEELGLLNADARYTEWKDAI